MLSADFSAETMQGRREWQDVLKVMKEKPTTKPKPPPGHVGPGGIRGRPGALREKEQERSGGHFTCLFRPGEIAELPGPSPALQGPPPPQPHWSWGHRKEAEGRTGEAGKISVQISTI